MKFTLYPRKAKTGTRWYYWYLDETNRPVRKSTGCAKRREAEAFLEKLQYNEEKKMANRHKTTFEAYSRDFFADSGAIVSRWISHGKKHKKRTLAAHRLYLQRYLLPWFKSDYLDEITAKRLDAHLIDARRINRTPDAESTKDTPSLAGATKNCIKDTLTVILKEALFDEKISSVPSFKVYARNSKRQNTLTDQELRTLFPFDQKEMEKIWGCRQDLKDKSIGQMFAVMAAVSVSCGLRSGEVVALSYEQIIAGKGLVIDRELDELGNVSFPKKGNERDPRFRVVPVSDFTLGLLDRWVDTRKTKNGLLFTYHGHAVSGGLLLKRFKRALAASNIDTKNRRITFHGLRYTFNTKMKNAIPREMLRDIIGHKSEEMTDLYDRPVLEERLDEYRNQILPAINNFWKTAL